MAILRQLVATRASRAVAVALAALTITALLIAVGVRSERALLVALVLSVLATGVQLFRRLDPALIVTVGIVLSVFSGNWSYLGFPFGIDRLVILAGVAAMVLSWRYKPPTRGPAPTWLYWLLAIVLSYGVISAFFVGSFFSSYYFFELMDAYGVVPFVLFVAAPFIFDTPERRGMLLTGLVVMAGYLGLTALFEGIHLNALVFPKYILNDSIGVSPDRARGPFLEAGANGHGLIVGGVACAMAAVQWKRRLPRNIALGILVLCIAGIVFTLTRQVWLGAIVGALITFVAVPRLRPFTLPAIAAGAVFVVALLTFVPGLKTSANERYGNQGSLWDRQNSNVAGINMFMQRPLLGFGWGSFASRSEPYFELSPTRPVSTVGHIHSVFISNLATLGLIGTAMWLVALLTALIGAYRRRGPPEFELWRMGFITVAISWLVIANFTPLTYGFSNYMVWFWAGLLYAGRKAEGPIPIPFAHRWVPAASPPAPGTT